MTITTFCLFAGRHDLPANEGPICSDFNFAPENFGAVKTPNWDRAIALLRKGERVDLLVTGLTPALTEFIRDAFRDAAETHDQAGFPFLGGIDLTLLHFNKDTGTYTPQNF